MPTEAYTNSASSTLNGGINDSVTSLVVASAMAFPASGLFSIVIDSEIMTVTAVAAQTFTVTRGAEGSTAASHLTAATVTHVITARSLDQLRKDDQGTGSYSALPAAAKQGRLFFPDDAPVMWYDDGTNQRVVTAGPSGGLVKLPYAPHTAADYTWINQGAAVALDVKGMIRVETPKVTSDNLRVLVKNVPADPYTWTIALLPGLFGDGFCMAGICLSDGTKVKIFSCMMTDLGAAKLSVDNYTNATTYGSVLYRNTGHPQGWPLLMRISDDSVIWSYEYSYDGQTWFTFTTEARLTGLTPTKVGFGTNATNNPTKCWTWFLSAKTA